MQKLHFFHVADLHLDTSFVGIRQSTMNDDCAAEINEATFTSLNNFLQECLKHKPDFVVFAGDIYNDEESSLKALLRMRELCVTLTQHNIKVFIAHGNHDPLKKADSSRWPEGVVVFGADVQACPVFRGDSLIAVVHGVSHITANESRNLAAQFNRIKKVVDGSSVPKTVDDAIPQIAILHCSLDEVEGSGKYAPTTLVTLQEKGFDYWALGHVHHYKTFGQENRIVYSGSMQGLHINEDGAHGCVSNVFQGRVHTEQTFLPVAAVQWEKISLDMADLPVEFDEEGEFSAVAALHLLYEHISTQVSEQCFELQKKNPYVSVFLVRLFLTGRTPLDSLLRRGKRLEELLDQLRSNDIFLSSMGDGDIRLWIKDCIVQTQPEIDFEATKQRDDLLGEVLRLSETLQKDTAIFEQFTEDALAPLFKNRRFASIIKELPPEEQRALLQEAELLCFDMLEAK